jgi:hypothetical protein
MDRKAGQVVMEVSVVERPGVPSQAVSPVSKEKK